MIPILDARRSTLAAIINSNIKPPHKKSRMALLKVIIAISSALGLRSFFTLTTDFNANGRCAALFKFVHDSGNIQKLLLAGVKRMALAANFRMELF